MAAHSDKLTIDHMPPLALPRWKEFLSSVAVIGRMVVWDKRALQIHLHLASQLSARDASTWELWGSNARRQEIAIALCEALMAEFGWPSPYFRPDDLLSFASMPRAFGPELFCAVEEAKRAVGIKYRGLIWPNGYDFPPMTTATVGDLVDALAAYDTTPSSPAARGFEVIQRESVG